MWRVVMAMLVGRFYRIKHLAEFIGYRVCVLI